jgi:hypothetical protein
MAQFTVRNIEDDIKVRLKRRAVRHCTSGAADPSQRTQGRRTARRARPGQPDCGAVQADRSRRPIARVARAGGEAR